MSVVANDQILAQKCREASPEVFQDLFSWNKTKEKQDQDFIYVPCKSVKKSSINRFLANTAIELMLWEKLKIPNHVRFPNLPSELIYGSLSDRTHLPSNLRAVFISNYAEKSIKDFFGYVSALYKLSIEDFSEEEAAAAVDEAAESDVKNDSNL